MQDGGLKEKVAEELGKGQEVTGRKKDERRTDGDGDDGESRMLVRHEKKWRRENNVERIATK